MNESISLRASHLQIGYERQTIQNDLSFSLKQATLTTILGANGAGKTTLLRTLSGFLPLLGGEILIRGQRLERMSISEMSRIIGVVLTEYDICMDLTIEELVSLGRQPYTGYFGKLSSQDKDMISRSIQLVGLSEKQERRLFAVSDGERQKAMIAKVLCQDCPFIILDEPTAYLDIRSRLEVLQLLKELAQKEQKTILMSSHDVNLSLDFSDSLLLMAPNQGGILQGTCEELLDKGMMDFLFPLGGISFDYQKKHFFIVK